jgi:hypothetical protein
LWWSYADMCGNMLWNKWGVVLQYSSSSGLCSQLLRKQRSNCGHTERFCGAFWGDFYTNLHSYSGP